MHQLAETELCAGDHGLTTAHELPDGRIVSTQIIRCCSMHALTSTVMSLWLFSDQIGSLVQQVVQYLLSSSAGAEGCFACTTMLHGHQQLLLRCKLVYSRRTDVATIPSRFGLLFQPFGGHAMYQAAFQQ